MHTNDPDSVRSIFVYGTLRPGQGNHAWTVGDLDHTARPGRVAGYALRAAQPMFPYAVTDPSAVTVGDLLTFGDAEWADALHACDALEGYPGHYDRSLVLVDLDGAAPVRAWIYHAPVWRRSEIIARYPAVPGNDWVAARESWIARTGGRR